VQHADRDSGIYFFPLFPMKFHIDLSSFLVEASDADEAYAIARKMIDDDPGRADICEVSPYVPEDHGDLGHTV
jgi:hypothetical protein